MHLVQLEMMGQLVLRVHKVLKAFRAQLVRRESKELPEHLVQPETMEQLVRRAHKAYKE